MENTQLNDSSVAQIFQKYLSSDERVVWSGKPNAKFYMNALDYIVLFFELFFLAGMTIVLKMTIGRQISSVSQVLADPFVLIFPLFLLIIVAYTVIYRPLKRMLMLKNSYYAVTNKRILQYKVKENELLESDINSLPGLNIRCSTKSDIGTLIFASDKAETIEIYSTYVFGMQKPKESSRPLGFINIPDVQRVCDTVNGLTTKPIEVKPITLT